MGVGGGGGGGGWVLVEGSICPSKLVSNMASIGPEAGASHTSLKYHLQKRHLEDGESSRGGARTQLSSVQERRTQVGGQSRVACHGAPDVRHGS